MAEESGTPAQNSTRAIANLRYVPPPKLVLSVTAPEAAEVAPEPLSDEVVVLVLVVAPESGAVELVAAGPIPGKAVEVLEVAAGPIPGKAEEVESVATGLIPGL